MCLLFGALLLFDLLVRLSLDEIERMLIHILKVKRLASSHLCVYEADNSFRK